MSNDEIVDGEADEEEDEELLVFNYDRYCPQLTVPPSKYSLTQVYRHIFGKILIFHFFLV